MRAPPSPLGEKVGSPLSVERESAHPPSPWGEKVRSPHGEKVHDATLEQFHELTGFQSLES